MPFFSGLAAAFGDRLTSDRAENAKLNEARSARENDILKSLVGSDDQEIASMAMTGLLDQATGRKRKGLAGWLGEVEGNPMLPTIRQLMAKGRQIPVDHGEGSTPPDALRSNEDLANPPPGPSAPPNRVPMGTGPGQAPGPTPFQQVARPAFDSPYERTRKEEEAKQQAHLNVFRQAKTEDEQQLVGGTSFRPQAPQALGQLRGSQAPQGSIDTSGRALDPAQFYKSSRRSDGAIDYDPIAGPVGLLRGTPQILADQENGTGRPVAYLVYQDGRPPKRLGEKPVRQEFLEYIDPDTQDKSYIPASSFERLGPVGQATPPPAAPGGSSVQPPPPAPQAQGATTTAPPDRPVAGTTTTARRPAGAISGGRASTATQTEGAVMGPDGLPRAATALYDAKAKTYYDPQNPTVAFANFIPGDMGKAAIQAFADGQATIDKIDNAIKAIQESGYGNSHDTADTLRLWMLYRGGANPASVAVGSLTSLASLAGASQYIRGNSRAFAMFNRASEHTAILPTNFEAGWGTALPGMSAIVTPGNAMRVGGQPWDSPASLIEKLTESRNATRQALEELRLSTGKTPDRAVGGGGPPAAPGAPSTIYARDPQGKRHEAPAGTPLPPGWTLEQ